MQLTAEQRVERQDALNGMAALFQTEILSASPELRALLARAIEAAASEFGMPNIPPPPEEPEEWSLALHPGETAIAPDWGRVSMTLSNGLRADLTFEFVTPGLGWRPEFIKVTRLNTNQMTRLNARGTIPIFDPNSVIIITTESPPPPPPRLL